MRKLKGLSVFLGLFLATSLVAAQYPSFQDANWVTSYAQDDTTADKIESPVILVKYIGDLESGTVDINGNLLELHSGALGSEDNAPSDSSDVNSANGCGSTDNALDVTAGTCTTSRALVSTINDSDSAGGNWVAVLVGGTGDEVLVAADYIDPADAQAGLPGGYAIRIDNSAEDSLHVLFRPDEGSQRSADNAIPAQQDIELFLRGPRVLGSADQDLIPNPFGGRKACITYISAYMDSTTAWVFTLYAVRYDPNVSGERSERAVLSRAGVDVTDLIVDLTSAPLCGAPGETFVAVSTDDALVTARTTLSGFFVGRK